MARFKSIYIRRSDGKQEVVVKGKRRETNEPLPDQLDTTPDKYGVSDFYREVAPDESKSLDWRRKLGGMIAREMRWDEGEYGYMLMTFPEAAKGTASYWKLIAAQSRLEPESIKGRWYEASLLLPVLQQAQYQELARKGDVQEASLWMNARGDCQNSNRPAHFPKMPRPNLRKETRESAFGKALPPGVEIKDGIEPPLPEGVDPALDGSMDGTNEGMQIDPKFDSADNAGDGSGGEAGGGAIDEFMNLEGDTMPGFGNEYASQASQSGFY
ncbi:hypothetical protein LTR56_012930 [Elasticomyces elasticus]|nr:hypothetical protein LTR56_012930 [Elasticomyces elasticus]